MKDISPDWFETCVSQLTNTGTQRVWSVLVTIFGDLGPSGSDQVSGSLITALTSLAGIKSEATRVALHRLRKEGWIESTRVGRTSVHRLTDFGRSQSAAAAPRIYSRETEKPDIWHVLIASGSESSRKELSDLMLIGDYISVNASTAMAPGSAPDGLEDLLAIESSAVSVPDWMRDLCGPEPLKDAYSQFWTTLQFVEQHLPAKGMDDLLQTAVLRVLIVHGWRRLILRHPPLPPAFLPEDWKGAECRQSVAQLLDRLPRPSLASLEAVLGD
ncbi:MULTISPECIES: PaaX family transcriptional regulator C-terminal domain-containing protein [unclassified Ruegeria]|uniref:PaaX family transcriptional regulator C-terminal domain-containing protein n=1 Tax=unclassified Ruegeria TaxID=2625375 RepID=UPI001489B4DA|nr:MULTISPECIES: PaaX family transcriptional regulator C-terminal domain-containing protein [unclassified Ruegeria]NOD64643.1 PaaX family transcriptional regulator [Ruegeria sp. HKCCD6109]